MRINYRNQMTARVFAFIFAAIRCSCLQLSGDSLLVKHPFNRNKSEQMSASLMHEQQNEIRCRLTIKRSKDSRCTTVNIRWINCIIHRAKTCKTQLSDDKNRDVIIKMNTNLLIEQ